jgi:hypothetical protein
LKPTPGIEDLRKDREPDSSARITRTAMFIQKLFVPANDQLAKEKRRIELISFDRAQGLYMYICSHVCGSKSEIHPVAVPMLKEALLN